MKLTLNYQDYLALSPLLILLFGGLVFLLLESFNRTACKRVAFPLSIAIFCLSIVFVFLVPQSTNPLLTPWLYFDSISKFFTLFFLIIGLGVTLLSYSFLERFDPSRGEYYFLLISSVIGMILIGQSADFLTLFLGLEALSISIYVLCGYMKKWLGSGEAALKYFLIGSIATAFFLYGVAFIYGAIGHTSFDKQLSSYNAIILTPERTLFLGGIALVTFGLIFKAAIVPFHFWAPDVYAGSPTPIAALMAIGIKTAAFAALVRVFMQSLFHFDPLWSKTLAFFVYPTLIYSSFVAIQQTHLRRFFAYSGISHAGFLLIPVAVGSFQAFEALKVYLVVYAIATLGAFATLASLERDSRGLMLQDLKGLFRKAPIHAALFSICLLTLAGFPPTVGFFAKFYVFKAAFEGGFYHLVILGLLASIFSAYYYFRFISIMMQKDTSENEAAQWRTTPEKIVEIGCSGSLIALSLFPSLLI